MSNTKISINYLILYSLIFASNVYSAQGMFFNVESNGLVLNISTNIPNQTYNSAGIKVLNTETFTLSEAGGECNNNNLDYCIFSISPNETKTITLSGSRGNTVNLLLCLNANSNIACQYYNIAISELLSFSGIRNDLSESDVLNGGFSVCYNQFYNSVLGESANTVKAPCTQDILLVACRETGASNLTVAAMALRTEVFLDSGSGQEDSHVSNGTQWYYSDNMSFGYAEVGDPIKRQNCDTLSANASSRLCWRTSNVGGGYRCGATMLLNNSTDWERVVYQRNGSL